MHTIRVALCLDGRAGLAVWTSGVLNEQDVISRALLRLVRG
jgi:hypothetical protein